MLRGKGGFTLIELVMIIVILGILAAVAIPRYADLTNQARTSACDGFIGAVKSGISIDWAASLAGTTVAYNGGTPFGNTLATFPNAIDTVEPGVDIPAYLLPPNAVTRVCDINVSGVSDTGDIQYVLTPAAAGPPSTPAYVNRTVVP